MDKLIDTCSNGRGLLTDTSGAVEHNGSTAQARCSLQSFEYMDHVDDHSCLLHIALWPCTCLWSSGSLSQEQQRQASFLPQKGDGSVGRGRIPGPLSDVTCRVLVRTKRGTTIDASVLAKLSEACYDMQITKHLGWKRLKGYMFRRMQASR